MTYTIITGNTLKKDKFIKEFNVHNLSCEFLKIDLLEIQSDDPKKVSINKARQAFDLVNKAVVVDDVGFYIDKYINYPGIYIKHTFKGLGIDNFLNLFNEDDTAKIVCTICLKDCDKEKVFVGEITGKLTKKVNNINIENPLSSIFIPNGHIKTLENLSNIKDHRTIAIKNMLKYLNENN